MEIFIELKKYFSLLGIKADKKSNFNAKNLIIVSLTVFCFLTMSLYIVFESESLIRSGNTIYSTACAALNGITISSNVMRRLTIFELFKRFEEIISKREKVIIQLWLVDDLYIKLSFTGSKNRFKMYKKTVEKIERWSRIVYFAMLISLPAIFVPNLCVSYAIYFSTDIGNDAFKPTFAMQYVRLSIENVRFLLRINNFLSLLKGCHSISTRRLDLQSHRYFNVLLGCFSW